TDLKIVNGYNIADLAVKWVNEISSALLTQYPDLRIIFGLHARSIQDDYPKMKEIDNRVEIMWEDIGGFPYSYEPDDIEKFTDIIEYTKKATALRKNAVLTGAVFKGMINLDWNSFEKQPDSFLMGKMDEELIKEKAGIVARRWRFVEKYYRRNLDLLLKTIITISENNAAACIVSLVEDGLWEEKMWLPVALYAESVWNPFRDKDELIEMVSQTTESFVLL
ncbi:MAG: hypothetical protein ACLFUI_10670, partial [Halanaerobiales bacterium]